MKVLEKFKNKKVFIAYLLGVLLLSTSVSFAYFTSKMNTSGSGDVAVGTTTVIESTGINAEGTIEFNNVDMYPGHKGIAGIRVTATGTTPMIYNVVFNGTNTFNTPLNYTIYKTTEQIDASYSCNKREEKHGINTYYYEECSGNNIEQLGNIVKSGTINKGEGKTTLIDNEIILGTKEGNIVYYYVVIEFSNEEANQNDDIGSSISGNITIEEGSEYKNPEVTLTGTTTSGNNGWVKSANISASVTTQTGKYTALYCTTSEDSCTPNTDANITDNSFNISLSNNTNPQKVCVEVTDEYNQKASGCSEKYLIDGQVPIISIASTSSTENSITITVSGSDAHSGIYQYKFSSNNGSSYTTVSSTNNGYTYTFNSLNDGTTYTIAVQAVDEAGNVSNTVTRNVATKSPNAKDVILANKTISNARSGAITGTLTKDTTGTVYSVEDDYGTSYVFAGAPTDNWLSFAGFYWRIIRINGNGSIRLIYSGVADSNKPDNTNMTGISTQIGTSAFNYTYGDNTYVGYMMGLANQCTSGSCSGTLKTTSYSATHANTNNSTIKGVLDNWYKTNIADKGYSDKISIEAGFCNDRQTQTVVDGSYTYGTLGYGTNRTGYAPWGRLYANSAWKTSQTPSLKCSQIANDMFTVSGSSKGNHKLTYPVGLITSDEVVLAGGFGGSSNNSYYLYTAQNYWTMSPYYFYAPSSRAFVFFVYSDGNLTGSRVNNTNGVRPVINLKADAQFTGSGTASDPYTVV